MEQGEAAGGPNRGEGAWPEARCASARRALAALGPVIDIQLVHFPAQGVAVNAQGFGGFRLIAVVALQDALDEALLEFQNSIREKDAVLDHAGDEGFKLVSHFLAP